MEVEEGTVEKKMIASSRHGLVVGGAVSFSCIAIHRSVLVHD